VNTEQLTALTEATALTRAGRLAEATALIQRTLNGGDAPVRVVPGEVVVDDERRRDDGPPQAPPGARCADGGLRDKLRDKLARAVDGVRTHLSSSAPTHLPGVSPGSAPSGLGALRDLLGTPTVPGGLTQPATPMPDLPGETVHRVYDGAAGARPYSLYVPTTGTGPRPLVVMLHGGTQTGADFAAATRMSELGEEHGVLVAYPEQVTSANPMRYWNWFEPGHQGRGGEPAILAGIVDEIAREHDVDRERVFVAGFSAGAAMAAVLGAVYPDVFAAVGVHSGLPHGSAHDAASAFAAMRGAARPRSLDRAVPVIAFHGDADPTVAVDNASRVVEQFTGGAVRGDTLVERGPGRPATRVVVRRGDAVAGELWTVHGSAHAWSGGVAGGSYTDPAGPDASAEMLRFFAEHPRR
jgi:poly(hydroxyalkanoate) depolymerase family esterase